MHSTQVKLFRHEACTHIITPPSAVTLKQHRAHPSFKPFTPNPDSVISMWHHRSRVVGLCNVFLLFSHPSLVIWPLAFDELSKTALCIQLLFWDVICIYLSFLSAWASRVIPSDLPHCQSVFTYMSATGGKFLCLSVLCDLQTPYVSTHRAPLQGFASFIYRNCSHTLST